jgi:ribosomal protein S14
MSLGFENVDKKTLNSYTKKSEKKVEMNTRRTCQHCGIPHFYINRKHIRAIIMSLSGNDTLKLSGAMMVTFYARFISLSLSRTNE